MTDELIGGHVPAPYCPECGQSENLEAYVDLLDREVVRLAEERDRWKCMVETDAMSRVAAEYRTEIDELETEVVRLTEALSWMSGHDRAGLNHLDEMMRASTERDDAETEVARLTEENGRLLIYSEQTTTFGVQAYAEVARLTAELGQTASEWLSHSAVVAEQRDEIARLTEENGRHKAVMEERFAEHKAQMTSWEHSFRDYQAEVARLTACEAALGAAIDRIHELETGRA